MLPETHTIRETIHDLSEILGVEPAKDGYLKVTYDLTRDDGYVVNEAVAVRADLRIKGDGPWMELQITVDTPCGLTRLSPGESFQLLESHLRATNLAVQAENLVRGRSWSQNEIHAYLRGEE